MKLHNVGDVVCVNNFPFLSKSMKRKLLKEGASSKHPLFNKGTKKRYAVVVGGRKDMSIVHVVQVMSHGGDTEKKGYTLRDDEVRIPQRTKYYNKRREKKNLYGVIKMERIEVFNVSELTKPLTSLPLRTKIDMVEQYNSILAKPYYKNKLDKRSPVHNRVMKLYKESMVAEKLKFMTHEDGSNQFNLCRYHKLSIKGIQKIGTRRDLNLYSVIFADANDHDEEYTHTIATRKTDVTIAKEWIGRKSAIKWLKEDVKYHALMNNIDQKIHLDPIPHLDKYESMKAFKQRHMKKRAKNMEAFER